MIVNRMLGVLFVALLSVGPAVAGTDDDTAKAKASPNATSAKASDKTAAPTDPNSSSSPTAASSAKVSALLDVLVTKGVLAPTEANQIRSAAPDAEFQLLVDLLNRKGILTAGDLPAAAPAAPSPAPAPVMQPSPRAVAPVAAPVASPATSDPSADTASYQPGPPPQAAPPPAPAGPTVAPAAAPVRVLTFDPPKPGGLLGVKIGPVTYTPYGFIKATAEHDSSSPNGDDFPVVGGLMLLPHSNTGPNADPEFHIKARQSRIGLSIEWPDISQKITLTGRIEADFEGNFNESDNSDVTSIRSPNPRLRLAYVRVDYRASDATSLFFVGGQDWTLFGSKALPNLLETTWVGASYGAIYNRTPQFRFGAVQQIGDNPRKFKISPEFAIQMPASGQVEKLTFCTLADLFCNGGSPTSGFLNQVGQAERQGADSDRPEVAAGLTLQFQLDKAPAVPPAQIFWTGFFGKRESIVTNNAVDLLGNPYPTALVAGTPFAKGYTASSDMYGNQVGVQLPTRWFTVVVSAYRGADLREILGGQLTTNYTNAIGLSPVFFGTGVDNVAGTLSGFAMLACTGVYNAVAATCSGKLVVAPEHGVRTYGGFAELGLPISRWFNANPKGHNAGWQLYLHAGKEQNVHRDALMQLGLADGIGPNQNGQGLGIPMIGSEFVGATLFYKINPWCTFAFEQTHYGSRVIPELGGFWTIAGATSRIWQDQREEFGPVFTF
jgi:hypothetical protein